MSILTFVTLEEGQIECFMNKTRDFVSNVSDLVFHMLLEIRILFVSPMWTDCGFVDQNLPEIWLLVKCIPGSPKTPYQQKDMNIVR